MTYVALLLTAKFNLAMEQQEGLHDPAEMEDEEFPDEFQCCVCLDIMYKPVVLACGHISCFWCVHHAMDGRQESHCPVCRNPYNHFPRVCKLLHFLLLKLYPSAYKRKERQVAEEEKKVGHTSEQFDSDVIDSQFDEAMEVRETSSPLSPAVSVESNATCEQECSLIHDSSKSTQSYSDRTSTSQATSNSQSIANEPNCVVEHSKQVLLTDLQCAVCKHLLCRPVVLNCGHVYCEACIHTHDSFCPICRSAHPNGLLRVCLVLEHFLEEHFPEEYSGGKQSLPNIQSVSPSKSSTENQQQAARSSSLPRNMNSPWFSGREANYHPFVGCDYCGMLPIIGLRYRCKDCAERIGFDLCEDCHNSSSQLPGRFNQQHTPDHQFEVVRPPYLRNIILSLGAEDSQEYNLVAANSDSPQIVLTVADLSTDDSVNQLELTAYHNSSDDEQINPEDVTVLPDSLSHSEDQDGDSIF